MHRQGHAWPDPLVPKQQMGVANSHRGTMMPRGAERGCATQEGQDHTARLKFGFSNTIHRS